MTTKPSQLREAILETADGMHRAGLMSEETLRKITVREMPDSPPTAESISGEEIRTVR